MFIITTTLNNQYSYVHLHQWHPQIQRAEQNYTYKLREKTASILSTNGQPPPPPSKILHKYVSSNAALLELKCKGFLNLLKARNNKHSEYNDLTVFVKSEVYKKSFHTKHGQINIAALY